MRLSTIARSNAMLNSCTSIRNQYQLYGVDDFYRKHGHNYQNPHQKDVHKQLQLVYDEGIFDICNVLDLCCGSGEVSSWVIENGGNVTGCDPFTHEAYLQRIGVEPLRYSFEDIVNTPLPKVQTIICSYALHLCHKSIFDVVCYRLAEACDKLVILTPHKKPVIQNFFDLQYDKWTTTVKTKVYSSLINPIT